MTTKAKLLACIAELERVAPAVVPPAPKKVYVPTSEQTHRAAVMAAAKAEAARTGSVVKVVW